MQIKFEHDKPEGWAAEHDSEGRLLNRPPLKGVHIVHTGGHAEQDFSRTLVEAGLLEGWVSLGQGKLTLHTLEEDLVYTILRTPGLYCCHCDMALGEDPSGMTGTTHIAQAHAGEESPNPSFPMGFRQTHAYECVLDEEQHARWNVTAAAQARLAAAAPEAETEYDPRQSRQRKRVAGTDPALPSGQAG